MRCVSVMPAICVWMHVARTLHSLRHSKCNAFHTHNYLLICILTHSVILCYILYWVYWAQCNPSAQQPVRILETGCCLSREVVAAVVVVVRQDQHWQLRKEIDRKSQLMCDDAYICLCKRARAQPIDGNDDSCLSLLAFLILSSHTTSIVYYIIIFSIRHTAHQAFTDEEDAAVHTGVDTLWKVRSMMRAYNMNVSTIVPNHLGYLIFFSLSILFHFICCKTVRTSTYMYV